MHRIDKDKQRKDLGNDVGMYDEDSLDDSEEEEGMASARDMNNNDI